MDVWVRAHLHIVTLYFNIVPCDTALFTLDNSLFYHSQVNAKDVNRFQLVSPTCLDLYFL